MRAEEVRAIQDPHLRARVAVSHIRDAEQDLEDMRDVRDFAFQELHFQQGESLRSIAVKYGVSKSLVAGATG